MIKLKRDKVIIENMSLFTRGKEPVIQVYNQDGMTYECKIENNVITTLRDCEDVVVVGNVKLINRIKFLFTKDKKYLSSVIRLYEVAE